MSDFNRYGIYVARVGDVLLRQLGAADVRPGSQKTEVIPGGAVDRAAVITAYADPMISLQTADFACLATLSLTAGYPATTAASANAASLVQFQDRADGGLFGSTPYVLTTAKSFTAVDEIRAEQDSTEGALISLKQYALSLDGIAAPFALSQASLTSTPSYGSLMYLGPVWIGDVASTPTQIKGIQSVSIKPGLIYKHKRAEGEPFAQRGSIIARLPEIAIRLDDVGATYTNLLSLFGKDITASIRLNCYFQAGVHGGTRVAKATTSHYRLTAQTGECSTESISVQKVDDATIELVMRPTTTLSGTAGVAIVV